MPDVKVPHSVQREVDKIAYSILGREPPVALLELQGEGDMLHEAWARTLRKIRRALPSVED